MDEWPPYLKDIWLGMPGREHGEAGLLRTAARKYARQLNSALALASQVRALDWLWEKYGCDWTALSVPNHRITQLAHDRWPWDLIDKECM